MKKLIVIIILLVVCSVVFGLGRRPVVVKVLRACRDFSVADANSLTIAGVIAIADPNASDLMELRKPGVWRGTKMFIRRGARRRRENVRLNILLLAVLDRMPNSKLRFDTPKRRAVGIQILHLIDGGNPNALPK